MLPSLEAAPPLRRDASRLADHTSDPMTAVREAGNDFPDLPSETGVQVAWALTDCWPAQHISQEGTGEHARGPQARLHNSQSFKAFGHGISSASELRRFGAAKSSFSSTRSLD